MQINCMKTMMPNVSNAFLILVSLLFAGHALASDCEITISQPHVAFGTFNRGSLSRAANGTQSSVIGNKSSTVTIACPRPEHIAVFYRTAAGHSAEGFQLGDIATVSLILSDAHADGKSTSLSYQQANGAVTSERETRLPLLPNVGITPSNNEPVTTLSLQLTTIATVNDVNVHIREHKTLNSSGTLEVVSE